MLLLESPAQSVKYSSSRLISDMISILLVSFGSFNSFGSVSP